ncbi:hypothetical protein HK097_007176 [Rhizophlyctis rosea]|uniref:Protein BIG1 n=1 Tax=Rhizophlyctis rosea TaxID=64517 RepID=A0AAD5X1S8_9FUNG|nr:hypothetical protein HK097_007176 [Rhizophlyctis rosea]
MRSLTSALTFLTTVLVAQVQAFEGTAPLIMWSSQPIKATTSPTVLLRSDIHSSLLDPIGCKKVNVIFTQPDVHASDLSRLSPSLPYLRSAVSDSATALEIPYVSGAHSVPQSVVDGVTNLCKESGDVVRDGEKVLVVHLEEGAELPALEDGNRYIFTTTLPAFRASGSESDAMSHTDRIIKTIMTKVKAATGDWVALYTSSGLAAPLHKRQDAPQESTVPYSKRSIFQKYSFFNQALFMCIAASVPLVIIGLIGARMLTSLQVPDRFEVPKKDK